MSDEKPKYSAPKVTKTNTIRLTPNGVKKNGNPKVKPIPVVKKEEMPKPKPKELKVEAKGGMKLNVNGKEKLNIKNFEKDSNLVMLVNGKPELKFDGEINRTLTICRMEIVNWDLHWLPLVDDAGQTMIVT